LQSSPLELLVSTSLQLPAVRSCWPANMLRTVSRVCLASDRICTAIAAVEGLPSVVCAADKLREDAENNPSKRITAPLDRPTAAWVLEPLKLAAGSGNAKLVEPALGCLHKLVGAGRTALRSCQWHTALAVPAVMVSTAAARRHSMTTRINAGGVLVSPGGEHARRAPGRRHNRVPGGLLVVVH
jgi:hypothetical protein